ncbi:MAG: sugar ABC transporter permease [Ruminococcaceae bacterium]|nr:sugar ABC transporter permease [Oscillospiraceae bacterium]
MNIKLQTTYKRNWIKTHFRQNWELYLMIIPIIAYYVIFCYVPMYGTVIAFQNYSPGKGILGSKWVGLKHFIDFLSSPDIGRLLRNTVTISINTLIFGFTTPIILALMMNELRQAKFKRVVQTVSYMPHFISVVVICGMIKDFVSSDGFISTFLAPLIGENVDMLTREKMFVPIYVTSGIWQTLGWDSIIYMAALSGIDMQLYEAAKIDGAGKWNQMRYVTIPGIMPTIIIMLILKIGSMLSVGYEKIILLYNPLIYNTSDVISTYVYRLGFESQEWSYTSAVGLFNSIINFILLVSANTISRKFNDTSLW